MHWLKDWKLTKRDKLERLDDLVLDAMIKAIEDGDTDVLRDLNVSVTFLKNNQVITPPEKEDSVHTKIANAVK